VRRRRSATFVGEPVSSTARRASLRIDRSYREALDARSLGHDLPWEQIEDPFADH
jgi:hypothetical protein